MDLSFEEVKIPVEWGHISGKWWGPKGIQPIVAMHAWQENCGSFDTLVPYLVSSQTSILAIDFPGHGFSSHYPEGMYYYFFLDNVHHLRRVVKHFKWQKVRLLGHSMGGAVSFSYAATYPDEVEFIICLDIASPAVIHVAQVLPKLNNYIDQFLTMNYEKETKLPNRSYNEIIEMVEDNYFGRLTTKSVQILMRRGSKLVDQNKHGLYCFTRDPRLKVAYAGLPSLEVCKEYAKRLRCGYLNIRAKSGEKFDYQNSYEIIVNEIEKVSSNFKKVFVEGNHHVHLNNPEKVAPIIQEFIKFYQPIKI